MALEFNRAQEDIRIDDLEKDVACLKEQIRLLNRRDDILLELLDCERQLGKLKDKQNV